MKSIALVSLATFFSQVAVAQGFEASNVQSALITVVGTGSSVESKVVQAVREAIADAYAKEQIENVTHLGYGIEGGYLVCVSSGAYATSKTVSLLATKVLALPHNPSKTELSVSFVKDCKDLTTP